jgi:putative phosphoesterase
MMSRKAGSKDNYTVGIISDTHGLLRPGAVDALEGSDLIVHAGDIGTPRIIDELAMLAPVVAVRGNMDNGGWAYDLKRSESIVVKGHVLYVVHDVGRLDIEPASAGVKAVIYGHSHKPSIQKNGGILYINPGSAGPRRFRLPVSVAVLSITEKKLVPRIIEL